MIRRVLLIGADAGLAQALANAPALASCAFESATGEADALRRLRHHAFGAVITNPSTSLQEDLPLLDEMRAIRPGVKTILLAPRAAPEEVIAALKARVFACFSAPFDTREIVDMVQRALGEADWRDGIEVVSANRDWISLRVNCRLLTAERLLRFLSELRSDLPDDDRQGLSLAFREILLNAMEHGGGFDPDQVVQVSAVRTGRAIVYYVRDPGPGFRRDALGHAAVSNPAGEPLAHQARRAEQGLRPGGFGMLLARKIVDELIYSEAGNEVLLIKHTT